MDSAKWIVDLLEEPQGDALIQLLTFLAARSEQMTLVVRDMDLAETGKAFLTSVSPFLTRSARCREWPGTVLLAGEATVLTYAVRPELIQTMLSEATGLYEFEQPRLPEDPCFYFEGREVFATISHERDAYLVLDDSEIEAVRSEVPGLKIVRRPRA